MVIRARLFFFAIIAFGCLLFFVHLSGTGGDFKLEYIKLKDIDSIKIYDRGLVGTNLIVFYNKDTNSNIGVLLKNSEPVNGENLNLKDSYGHVILKFFRRTIN